MRHYWVVAGLAVRSIMQAAKFLYRDESKARPDEGEKACEVPWITTALQAMFMLQKFVLNIATDTHESTTFPHLGWLLHLSAFICRADHDLMVVRELRKMANDTKAASKIAPRSADEKLKWLEWPEFVTVSPISSYILYDKMC